MIANLTVSPWPALLSLEGACRYLSLERELFLALASRSNIEAVDVGDSEAMWRTRDLDALLRRLPTLKPSGNIATKPRSIDLGKESISQIVEALARVLASRASGERDKPLLVSIKEASNQLSLGRTRIYTLVNNGTPRIGRIGRRTLITQESIQGLLDS